VVKLNFNPREWFRRRKEPEEHLFTIDKLKEMGYQPYNMNTDFYYKIVDNKPRYMIVTKNKNTSEPLYKRLE